MAEDNRTGSGAGDDTISAAAAKSSSILVGDVAGASSVSMATGNAFVNEKDDKRAAGTRGDDDPDPWTSVSEENLLFSSFPVNKSQTVVAAPTESGSPQKEIEFIDHFSLGKPSNTIRFRQQRVQLYDLNNQGQILLKQNTTAASADTTTVGSSEQSKTNDDPHARNDDDDDNKILVQKFDTSSFGSRLLRLSYSVVTFLMLCFLLAFCFQVIIFLFLNMASHGGKGEDAGPQEDVLNAWYIIAVILSVPLFLYGMASLMSLGGTFMGDVFRGNPLFRQIVGGLKPIIMESICLAVFVVIPGLTAAISLLSKSDVWWEVTAWTWITCDLIFFFAFCLFVVRCEIKTTYELLKIVHDNENADYEDVSYLPQSPPISVKEMILKSILITETMSYSGYRKQQYLVDANNQRKIIKSSESLYARMTQWSCWASKEEQPEQDPDTNDDSGEPSPSSLPGGTKNRSIFQLFESPLRAYQIDEVR